MASSSAKRFFSSPKATAIVPIAIVPVMKNSARPSSTESSVTTTNTSERQATVPVRQKSNRVQPLHPREAHIQERGKLDIWMLGLTIVIGGQYYSWNAGLAAGFYSFFLAFLLTTGGYVTLCMCTAEIAGALPFAGGAYGLSRCTLGFFPGFIIGCCEALEYIAYVSTTVILFADLIVDMVPELHGYEPLVWLFFYATTLAIQLKGGRVFWGFNLLVGAVSLFIVLIFVFGSMPFLDYEKHVEHDPGVGFVDGFAGFMHYLPLAPWFYVGVEALPMACDDVMRPKTIVPKAQVMCVLTLAATGILVYWITAMLPGGEGGLAGLATVLAPFNTGFELMFKISSVSATLLSLPATYATAFGFVWCYGKLIHAMATSRLLPPMLSRTTNLTGIPYVALIIGSAMSYALCVVVYVFPSIAPHLFPICITAAFVAYAGQCIGYISLKKNYRNIKSSHFVNPFGIAGALFSLAVWILCLVAIACYQKDGQIAIFSFLTIVALLTVFYFAYAKKRQTFSPQENKVLLVAHVMKFNATRFSGKSKNRSRATSRGTATTKHDRTNKASSHANVSQFTGGASNFSEVDAPTVGPNPAQGLVS